MGNHGKKIAKPPIRRRNERFGYGKIMVGSYTTKERLHVFSQGYHLLGRSVILPITGPLIKEGMKGGDKTMERQFCIHTLLYRMMCSLTTKRMAGW